MKMISRQSVTSTREVMLMSAILLNELRRLIRFSHFHEYPGG